MIKITRTERETITDRPIPISEDNFDNEGDAGTWLKKHVPQITNDNLTEIFNNAENETHFEVTEMVDRGRAAYSAHVVYQILINLPDGHEV